MNQQDRRGVSVRRNVAAILGCSCRLPGAVDERAFWELLDKGQCSVTEIPGDRWSHARYFHPRRGTPGRSYTFAAGVLDDINSFDAAAFGMSPREAEQIDPQQRLMLELVREALEDAAIPLDSLGNQSVGVFVGASSLDHSLNYVSDISAADTHFVTGNALSIISNRISYVFGFTGPSFTIDTACSSSLVAFDRAVKAIEAGEIDTAIVAGVNILANPYYFVGFSRAGMLSPTGRCRPFSASADGYVRAEGGVVTVLSRLDRTKEAGLTPRAVVVGTGTNSDGRTVGIAMPATKAQQKLLEDIYAERQINPDDLAFVEAHGTGTLVGDPAEANAIGSALGKGRETPLPIGSVKSNIGHLEPASGLAGLLKSINALERGRLPATLHLDEINEDIDFDDLNLAPAVAAQALPADKRLAGISSFGFGGTNAHAVIRLPEPDELPEVRAKAGRVLVISAQDPNSLKQLASRYADTFDAADDAAATAGQLAHAAAWSRTALPYRLVLRAEGQDVAQQLRAAADTGSFTRSLGSNLRHAFVFSGNGGQFVGMGATAWQTSAGFRATVQELDESFRPLAGWSLADAFGNPPAASELAKTEIAQPLIFALEVALARTLMAETQAPSVVFGHSVGEIAAACIAGAFSHEDAVKLIYWRSQLQAKLRGQGTMAFLMQDAGQAQALIDEIAPGKAVIAAYNAPKGVTLSGETDPLASVLKAARRKGIVGKRLDIDYPFHSPALEPLKDEIISALKVLQPRATTIPFVSTVTGQVVPGESLDADYWWRNIRQAVHFDDATRTAAAREIDLFIEIGPRPVLAGFLRETLGQSEQPTLVLASLQEKDRDDACPVDRTLLAMLTQGVRANADAIFGAKGPVGRVDLPKTPWNRQLVPLPRTTEAVNISGRGAEFHPLLGSRLTAHAREWRSLIDIDLLPYLADHCIGENILVPATAMAEMLLAAGRERLQSARLQLEDFSILDALRLEPGQSVETLVRLTDDGLATLSSRPHGEGDWQLKARGRVVKRDSLPKARSVEGSVEAGDVIQPRDLYETAAQMGLNYGPAFQLVTSVAKAKDHIALELAQVEANDAYVLSPTLADASLHGLALVAKASEAQQKAFVPVNIARLIVDGPARPERALLRVRKASERSLLLDVELLDAQDQFVARMEGVRLRALELRAEPKLDREYDFTTVSLGSVNASHSSTAVDLLAALPNTQPGDDLLLLDAAAAAIAHRAVADIAELSGSEMVAVDPRELIATGKLAADKETLFSDLLYLLEDAGLAQQSSGSWQVAVESNLPEAETLLTETLALAPNRGVEITLAARLAKDLPASLRSNASLTTQPALLKLWHSTSESAREIGRKAADLATVFAGNAETTPTLLAVDRTGILLDALAPLAAARKITLVVKPIDAEAELHLAARLAGNPHVLLWRNQSPTAADLVLSVDTQRLPATVKSGGSHFGLDIARTGFAALVAAGTPRPDAHVQSRVAGQNGLVDVFALPTEHASEQNIAFDAEAIAHLTSDGLAAVLITDKGSSPVDVSAGLPETKASDLLVLAFGAPSDASEFAAALARARDVAQAALEKKAAPSLRFVIRGNPLAGNPGAAALWAFGRVVINEYPDLDIRLVALAEGVSFQSDDLRWALAGLEGERELIVEATELLGVRAAPRRAGSSQAEQAAARLFIDRHGSLDRLGWKAVSRHEIGDKDVEIEVTASALNFRDVMFAQGLIGDDMLENGFAGPSLGFECAGVVVRKGKDVQSVQEGDLVAAFAPHAMASHVVVDADLVLPLPTGMDAESGATILVAFLTAWYGLVHCAQLRAGETVLIHGAAGALGMAAIQIAKAKGARIIATAGSPEKRALATLLGADMVYSSRDLDFADEIRDLGGADVVLNSIAGRAMEESVGLLKPFGRFVEVGKRDFIGNTRLGLRPFAQNLTYFGVDADQLLAALPVLVRDMLVALRNGFADGEFSALPYIVFSADDVQGAFRLMQGSGHVGKILVHPPSSLPTVAKNSAFAATADGVHLVVGGGTGFGREAVRWLARSGARKIVVASRRGVIEPPLAIDGVSISAVSCDIRDLGACNALVADLKAEHGRIAGVIHTAMVLDDALLRDLDAERAEKVLAPKIDGARNLDAALADTALDYFVLFSSATTLIGNPGQSAYVMANAYLEGLARKRRAEGKPALAVAWGAIADAGVLARDKATADVLRHRLGLGTLTAEDALNELGRFLVENTDEAVRCCAPIDWRRAKELSILASSSFAPLRPAGEEADETSGETDLANLIRDLPAKEAKATLLRVLTVELGRILRLPPDGIDVTRPLTDLGVDSLMALELDMEMQHRHKMALPMLGLGAGATLQTVTDKVLQKVHGASGDEDAAAASGALSERSEDGDTRAAALIEQHVGEDLALPELAGIQDHLTEARRQVNGRLVTS